MIPLRIPLLGIVLVGVLWAPVAVAQLEDNLSAFTDETAEGYLKPLQSAFGQALNTNWFTTASIPSQGVHARLDIKAMSVFFKNDDDFFNATTGGAFTPAQTVEAPTVVGPEESVSVIGDGNTRYVFPGGFNLGSLSIGVPQLTVSGFRGSEATVRWIAVDTGDAEIGDLSLFGIGVRHTISQYLTEPPLDLAAGIFYQTFSLGDNLIDSKAWSFGVQGSRSFGVLTPFAGLAFDSFSMTAEYTFDDGTDSEDIKLDLESENSLHLTLGAGVNLGPMRLSLAGDLAERVGVTGAISGGF